MIGERNRDIKSLIVFCYGNLVVSRGLVTVRFRVWVFVFKRYILKFRVFLGSIFFKGGGGFGYEIKCLVKYNVRLLNIVRLSYLILREYFVYVINLYLFLVYFIINIFDLLFLEIFFILINLM